MSSFLVFNLVSNLNSYVNYYLIIIIVPEKPHWGGSIKHSFIHFKIIIVVLYLIVQMKQIQTLFHQREFYQ